MSSWAEIHKNTYAKSDWINRPSLFAETAIKYFPKNGRVLELGAGQGQDSRYFAERGHDVTSTDLEPEALAINAEKSAKLAKKLTIEALDLSQPFPYKNESFDVIYAHLSLHYFDTETSWQLLGEIFRVLKKGGVFALLVNSVNDPEYGSGRQIEPDYFQIDKLAKRYFSLETTRHFTQFFDTTLLDDLGETYKDNAKGVHNLIRFVGTKPAAERYRLAIPFTGAIVERGAGEEKEVLLQTRWQPGGDPVYTGTLEFPVGRLDKPYENIFDALSREINEETGLVLESVIGEDKTAIMTSGRGDAAIGFRPFCCLQQLKNGKPWVGFIFICTVEPGEPRSQLSETREVHWQKASEVEKMFKNTPEKFFALELPAWDYYFKQLEAHD